MDRSFFKGEGLKKIIFVIVAGFCLTPFIDPPLALLLGFIFSSFLGRPFKPHDQNTTKILLQVSVIGLGFGINIFDAAKAGKEGFIFTITTIGLTLLIGIVAGKLLSINKKTSLLISSGTAICGGSAIAAVSPAINAREDEISVSLGTVFILNSLALFIFPIAGHYFEMSQSQFGLWAAIAIHDTSSVVGAAQKFGAEALEIATVVKLGRALWIIPVSLVTAMVFKNNQSKVAIPYFILLFVVAMAANTFIPQLHPVGEILVILAKKGLTLTLFLIGAQLTRSALKAVGIKPLILGVMLWVFISLISLFVILQMG